MRLPTTKHLAFAQRPVRTTRLIPCGASPKEPAIQVSDVAVCVVVWVMARTEAGRSNLDGSLPGGDGDIASEDHGDRQEQALRRIFVPSFRLLAEGLPEPQV
jgi:hypothetical protein